MKNNKSLFINSTSVYIFDGYIDCRDDEYGPCFGDEADYKMALYYPLNSWESFIRISIKEMKSFEKDKFIIKNKKYVSIDEAKKICREELENLKNITAQDLIERINERIEDCNYINSPKYKEKLLLDKINELYFKVKGEFIEKEVLYSGKFLEVVKEVYKLPDGRTVEKEKINKNNGKNSVIIIPQIYSHNIKNDCILTFQTRINGQVLAEFPSGYIEENETLFDAAKRELLEETGYSSDDIVILDEAYTSPGIDNSKTYIVLANNCQKIDNPSNKGTELLNFGIFTRRELDYLVDVNIMNGSMNKLAYCRLINYQPGARTKRLGL